MHKVVLSHGFSTRSFARRHGPNDGPADRTQTNADVLIDDDGLISAVAPGLSSDNAKVVDVAGHIVAPGMIDLGVGLGLR